MQMYDIVVVGGGPAGITAAMYAARAGKSVLVLEKEAFGGQIATSPCVENYPAVSKISGSALADSMFNQALEHGVQFDMGTVSSIERSDNFVVNTEYATVACKSVILATGVSHKKLGLPNEQHFVGNGVCYCAVCDGAFYKDKAVCVVGDGNSAAQYALYLSEICSQVTLVTLFNRLFCDKYLEQRLLACANINWMQSVRVTEIVGDDRVKGLVCRDDDGAVTYLDCDAVFVAIGQQPNNENFASLVDLDHNGYIIAGENCVTQCKGVFAAGDCRTKTVRQCTTAVGDGAVAGIAASAYVDTPNAE